jgi:hypothetical protein
VKSLLEEIGGGHRLFSERRHLPYQLSSQARAFQEVCKGEVYQGE